MDQSNTPASSGPSGAPFDGSIFWNPNEAVDLIEMPLPLITKGTQDMGNGVYLLRAGTPLDEYFAVANDEDAKYVVAEDFYFISTKPDQAKVVPLITAGYVDINKAEQAAGITYSQDCIDALADEGIVLVDGTLPSSGGGGGGSSVITIDFSGRTEYTEDEVASFVAAIRRKEEVIGELNGTKGTLSIVEGMAVLGIEGKFVSMTYNAGNAELMISYRTRLLKTDGTFGELSRHDFTVPEVTD